ncbi:MAG: cation diffusion facilitator family transporter [Candidatus Poribacteria bacterium]|nr:cation diffusion facilitator family transporter [Candidatus Poribacteria bacterium]
MDNCCDDKGNELEQLRERQSKTLWIVLGINGVMFCLELCVGLLAGSVALQADSLDMLSDTLVYGFSLYAIGKSNQWRAGSALLKGSIMAIFGIGVLFQTVHKFLAGGIPESHFMFLMSMLALIANASCLLLLSKHKTDDINMRSTWVCSRNDIIANTSVFVAAALVAITQSKLPDVVVGLLITSIFLKSAISILKDSYRELRQPTEHLSESSSIPKLLATPELCATGTCPVNACLCGGLY